MKTIHALKGLGIGPALNKHWCLLGIYYRTDVSNSGDLLASWKHRHPFIRHSLVQLFIQTPPPPSESMVRTRNNLLGESILCNLTQLERAACHTWLTWPSSQWLADTRGSVILYNTKNISQYIIPNMIHKSAVLTVTGSLIPALPCHSQLSASV